MKRVPKCIMCFVLLLATLELSFRLLLSIPFVAERFEKHSWRYKWVRRHRNGTRIYPFDAYDSTKGWVPIPNLRDVQAFKNKTLNTNSRGLRGKTEYSYDKRSKKVRILTLGDSFTFGEGVSDNETYSYYLQKMLPKAEVINMGVRGYGHDQMLILFKEEGVKYHPDIVILGFLTMDMSRNLQEFRDYAKPRFVVDSGKLKVVGSPVPRPEHVLKWDWVRPRIYEISSVIVNLLKELTALENKEKEKKEILTLRILDEMVEVAHSIRAIPIFVYLPVGGEMTHDTPLAYGEKFLFAFCRRNGRVRCFSSRPNFAEETAKGTKFELGGHWAPSGHLVVAKAIMRYLLNQGYVVPPVSN